MASHILVFLSVAFGGKACCKGPVNAVQPEEVRMSNQDSVVGQFCGITAGTVRLILAAGTVLAVGGCSTDPVFLRHPQTGKKVQCGPYSMTGWAATQAAPIRERGCIEDYQRQGYERVME